LKERASIELTLAGETGRQTISTDGHFQFNPVAPGRYELYGSMPEGECVPPPTFLLATYQPLAVEEDRTDLKISLSCVQLTTISYLLLNGGNATDTRTFALQARRKDMAGIVNQLNLGNGPPSAVLAPGRWELLLQPGTGYAVTGFYGVSPGIGLRSRDRADGWNEITAGDNLRAARFVLSNSPGSLRGTVTGTAHEAVMGAPVYLEGYDSGSKTRIGELRTAYTDTLGMYQFSGLAPGAYRVLATFEYTAPDTATIESCAPKTVNIARSDAVTQDLDLFVLK
jgi:hypothetical protein